MKPAEERREILINFDADTGYPHGVIQILSSAHYDFGHPVKYPLHFFVRSRFDAHLVRDADFSSVFFVTLIGGTDGHDPEMQEFVLNLAYTLL